MQVVASAAAGLAAGWFMSLVFHVMHDGFAFYAGGATALTVFLIGATLGSE